MDQLVDHLGSPLKNLLSLGAFVINIIWTSFDPTNVFPLGYVVLGPKNKALEFFILRGKLNLIRKRRLQLRLIQPII